MEFKKLSQATLLVFSGILSMVCVTDTLCAAQDSPKDCPYSEDRMQMAPDQQQFCERLNADSKKMFMEMNDECRAMAMKMSNAKEGGTMKDPNEAVKMAYQHYQQQMQK